MVELANWNGDEIFMEAADSYVWWALWSRTVVSKLQTRQKLIDNYTWFFYAAHGQDVPQFCFTFCASLSRCLDVETWFPPLRVCPICASAKRITGSCQTFVEAFVSRTVRHSGTRAIWK
jgi:hypothetical protein